MDLRQLIESVDQFQTKAATEIASTLNAASVEVRDNQLYTWAGVALLVGPANAETLRVALESKQGMISTASARWNAFVAAVDSWDGSGAAPTL